MALLRGASKRLGGSSSAHRGTLLPSMYSFSRAFSSKLFVGGLSYHTNEEMLRKAFSEHGDVVDVRIITDRDTGRSRGFGFITFSSESDAEAAKAKMSNHLLDGRFIRVDLASARPPQSVASPRGNSSSPSGFSFGTPGTRPPSVEDWGPLPSYSTNTTQTNTWGSNSSISPSQGAPDTLNGGMSPTTSSFGSVTSSSSSAFQQLTSSTSNMSAFQSSTRASEVQSSSFDSSTSSSVASVTAQQSTVFTSGIVSSTAPGAASTQGIIANDSTSANMSSFQMGTGGQSPPSQVSSEAGQTSAHMGSSMQSSNVTVISQSGPRSDMGSGVSSTSGTAPFGSSTKYDFRNFPDLTSNAYKDYKPPGELQEPKRRVILPSSNLGPKRAESWQAKLTEAAIPPAKSPAYDFGLAGIPDAPPPLEAGANPQGVFNLSVSLDELPEAEPVRLPYSIFTARPLPPLDLPYLTPEADNWSEIGKPPRRIEDSPYSPFSPDLKDDPEFWWDPYDFDPEAKLLKEAFAEEPAEEAKASKESEAAETKASKELEEEAKTPKEPEAEESPAVNAAAS